MKQTPEGNKELDRSEETLSKPYSSGTNTFGSPYSREIYKRALKTMVTKEEGGKKDFCLRILPNIYLDHGDYAADQKYYRPLVFFRIQHPSDKYPRMYYSIDGLGAGDCPLMALYNEACKNNDNEARKKFLPARHALMWVIDRDDEAAGPKLFRASPTVFKNIVACFKNSRTKKQYIPYAEDGYDVQFTMELQKNGIPMPVGVQRDGDTSPIHEDDDTVNEWLSFVQQNPLRDIVQFYSKESILAYVNGDNKAEQHTISVVDTSFQTDGDTLERALPKADRKAARKADRKTASEVLEGIDEIEEEEEEDDEQSSLTKAAW